MKKLIIIGITLIFLVGIATATIYDCHCRKKMNKKIDKKTLRNMGIFRIPKINVKCDCGNYIVI